MNKRYESKLERLEKIKKQIKDEEKRIEQEIGKHALKTFDLSYEDLEKVKSIIDDLYLIYDEQKEDDSLESESNENNDMQLNSSNNNFNNSGD